MYDAGTSGFRWILDPIDGTKSFISGVPLYGTLVGVEYQGRSQIGVIFIPGLNECVYAARRQGAWHDVRSRLAALPGAAGRLASYFGASTVILIDE